MTFLNPLVLLGLAAAAIPVLLHLFNLRKLKRIEFSTLTFLKELQKTRIRRLKLRQLLLLFLRTVLIILVVTAFSRPTLKTSYFGGTRAQAKTTAVFIIDNSYSMTSTNEDGQLLKQAKDGASNILQLMKDGDEVFVLKVSDVGSSAASGQITPMRDFAAARAEMRSIEPSYIHRTIEDALRVAAGFLSSSKNLNKEVYVFSDFKIGSLLSKTDQKQTEQIVPPQARFFLIPEGKKVRENLGVESVEIENALFGTGKPLNIKTKVSNWGSVDVKNDVISVFLNGTRVAQKALDIQAQNSAETEFSLTPTSTGYLDGEVEIQDDDLEFDNRRPFNVYIPEHLKVLLVGDAKDLRYLRMALSAQPAEGESIINVNSIPVDRLSTNEIDASDVIMFANVRELSSAQGEQTRSFVQSGGGLIIFPGSRTDSTSFYSTWSNSLGVPPSSSPVTLKAQIGQPLSMLEFDKIDFHHPIFKGMFIREQLRQKMNRTSHEPTGQNLESPTIRSYVRYQTNLHSLPIITLSDESPFMLEQRINKGDLILFGVSATTDWSDFPLKGIFVPLIHASTAYVAQRQSVPPEATAGGEVHLGFKNRGLSKVTVRNPQNIDVAADITNSSRESILRFRETSLPGIYSVRSGNELLKKFVVTLDPEESNTVRADDKAIATMLQRLGLSMNSVETIRQNSDVRQRIIQSRVGLELWKYFVAAALLASLIELIVARTKKSELGREGPSGNFPDSST